MKNPFLVVIGISLVITVVFLWQEPLSLKLPIDGEKTGAYATALAAVFTAFTVYLLFKQNKHLQEEKKLEIQPDLFPAGESYLVEEVQRNGKMEMHFSKWDDFEMKKVVIDFLNLTVHNIGLGVAKNIEYLWYYDIKEVKAIIRHPYKVQEYFIEISRYLDFIPANGNHEVMFPQEYLHCLAPEYNQITYNKEKDRDEFPLKPRLKLQLKFMDVYNNSFVKYFEAIFTCSGQYISIRFIKADSF